MKVLSNVVASTVAFSLSIVWTVKSRPEVCYKKYLGPDWKPTYENPGAKVGNHSSVADICIHMKYQSGSFICKSSVMKIPFVGTVAKACGSLFFDRSSKDERKNLTVLIAERMKLCA